MPGREGGVKEYVRSAAKRAVDAGISSSPNRDGRIEAYVQLLDHLRPQQSSSSGSILAAACALRRDRAPAPPGRDRQATARHPLLAEYLPGGGSATPSSLRRSRPAHTARLAEIVDEAFGDEPLDLVVDDCSHRYKPSRASFNELFPRLRPGGVYVIEDWPSRARPGGRRERRRVVSGRGAAHAPGLRGDPRDPGGPGADQRGRDRFQFGLRDARGSRGRSRDVPDRSLRTSLSFGTEGQVRRRVRSGW